MGDYRWLKAVVKSTCGMCQGIIRQGDGFYYEVDHKVHYCRDCGRAIRLYGEKGAAQRRGFLNRLFESMGGESSFTNPLGGPFARG